MKIYETWENLQELCQNEMQQRELWNTYYIQETEAYKIILGEKNFNLKATAKELAEKLYTELTSAGIEVIIDTTDDRAGSKFANADLIGAPIRAIISPKNLEHGVFEMKYSGLKEEYPETIPVNKVFEKIQHIVKDEL